MKVRITSGDTVTDLAQHYYGGVTPRVLEMIRDANPWLRDPDVIWTGRMLTLPAPRVTDDPPRRRAAPTAGSDLPAPDEDPFSDVSPDDDPPAPADDDTGTP